MKLVDQYMLIFFHFSPTLNHLHPWEVENCHSNSQLVVDEGDYGKFRLARVNVMDYTILSLEIFFENTSFSVKMLHVMYTGKWWWKG